MSLEILLQQTNFEGDILDIKKTVADFYHVPIHRLDEKSRKREIVRCRQIAYWLSCKLTCTSLAKIGDIIGQKGHSTVIYGKRQIDNHVNLIKGRIPDNKLYSDLSRILILLRNVRGLQEEIYYLSMGTMISYQNYSES